MNYRNLGKSGLRVSAVGLGTNQFGGKVDASTVTEIISAAIDHGVNFIDTADVYQEGRSEETIGAAIKGRRDGLLIATKARFRTGDGPNDEGVSRYRLIKRIESSLKRLGTDYVDLYQMHAWDPNTPIEETMSALDQLIREGKVRYIGCSNYQSWQLIHANTIADRAGTTPFVTVQSHYHMLERELEREVIPAADYFGLGILPYFPLAGGFLTGKYQKGKPVPAGSRGESNAYVQKYMTDANFDVLDRLASFAADRDHTLGDLAHAWLLARPEISSVISGVTSVEHVGKNAVASGWELTADEFASINEILDKPSA